jgi:transcriptional regulator with GAF, ATPase, and Fis domain
MITGFGSEGVAARALHLGALGYLIKPFTTEEVLTSVERALTVRDLRRQKAQLDALLDTYGHHIRTISVLSRALATGLPRGEIYQRVVEAAAFVTRSDRCLLARHSGTPGKLCVLTAIGDSAGLGRDFDASAGDARLRPVLQAGKAIRLQATPGSSIILQTGDTTQSVLQAPLQAYDEIIGLLSVDRRQASAPFGRHDERMLSILADLTAIAWAMEQRHVQSSPSSPSQP